MGFPRLDSIAVPVLILFVIVTILFFRYLRREVDHVPKHRRSHRPDSAAPTSPDPAESTRATSNSAGVEWPGSKRGHGFTVSSGGRPSVKSLDALAAFFVLISVFFVYQATRAVEVFTIRMAVPSGGEYRKFIDKYQTFLNRPGSPASFRIAAQQRDSTGSVGTRDLIADGTANLGVVQSNTTARNTRVRTLAHIFPEYLFVITKNGQPLDLASHGADAPSPTTFTGRLRIACFGKGSQTYDDVNRILKLYGLERWQDYALIARDYEGALDALVLGEADAAIFIASKENETLKAALRGPDPEFQINEQAQLDHIVEQLPPYQLADIPGGHFGRGTTEYETIAIQATLICSSDLPQSTIEDLTSDLFENRSELIAEYRGLRLEEPSTASSSIAIHRGARDYFEREAPSFMSQNSGIIQSILSLLSFTLAGIAFVHGHRSRNMTQAPEVAGLEVDSQQEAIADREPPNENGLVQPLGPQRAPDTRSTQPTKEMVEPTARP